MSLRVMTWNLWWRFGAFEQRQAAIVNVIRQVAPDIVCLQEVWSNEHDDQCRRLGEALGMYTVRTDPVLYRGESFGNAIASRWPIERTASEWLPNSTGAPGHRRVVAGMVDTPVGRWPVASAHLDHRFDASATRIDQATRLMQLAATWRGDPDHDLPLIVGADLNAVPDSDEVRMLTGRRPGVAGIVFTDVWEQAGGHGAGVDPGHTWRAANPHTADSAWPNRRLDYLLVSWPRPKPVGNPIEAWTVGTDAVEVDGRPVWPSDHAAVVADFVTPT